LDVRPQRFDRDLPDCAGLVLVGRGPGDPRDRADLRVARPHEIARDLLAGGTPFLAVCLGRQVLADELRRAVRRLKTPRQGLRQTISLNGRPERVGCYDTFVATSGADRAHCPFTGESVHVPRDPRSGAGHASSKPLMRSTQFTSSPY